jgi:predicted metal-dependent hydrolase
LGIESPNFKHPNEGDIVSVEYDPSSKKVRFDMSDPALQERASRKAHDEATHARYEQALNAGVGQEPASDRVDQLRGRTELVQLRAQGLLTDEEFAAAMARLLG